MRNVRCPFGEKRMKHGDKNDDYALTLRKLNFSMSLLDNTLEWCFFASVYIFYFVSLILVDELYFPK